MTPTLLAVVGPTATGKSALAIALAQRAEPRGEIVNCDSTAVYQQFDIGTDKVPMAELRTAAWFAAKRVRWDRSDQPGQTNRVSQPWVSSVRPYWMSSSRSRMVRVASP